MTIDNGLAWRNSARNAVPAWCLKKRVQGCQSWLFSNQNSLECSTKSPTEEGLACMRPAKTLCQEAIKWWLPGGSECMNQHIEFSVSDALLQKVVFQRPLLKSLHMVVQIDLTPIVLVFVKATSTETTWEAVQYSSVMSCSTFGKMKTWLWFLKAAGLIILARITEGSPFWQVQFVEWVPGLLTLLVLGVAYMWTVDSLYLKILLQLF